MNPVESAAPPPLPVFPAVAAPNPRQREHLRNASLMPAVAVLAAAAADCAFYSADLWRHGAGGYGVAAATGLATGMLLLMRRDWDRMPHVWLALLLAIAGSAAVGSGISTFLSVVLLIATVSRPAGGNKGVAGVSRFSGLPLWIGALAESCERFFGRTGRARLMMVLTGIVAAGAFLFLLGSGNAALAGYLAVAGDLLGDLTRATGTNLARIGLWCCGVFAVGLFAAPRPVRRPSPAADVVPARVAGLATAALVGANLAFLASNLTDTYWIGFRHSAPAGVSTTDYLYSGVYALMADAVVAAVLLLVLFRKKSAARGDRLTKSLGALLAAQCVWLGFGVAGRVAFHIDRYGFTPNRIWVAVILLWGFAALAGVVRYLRGGASVRGFFRHLLVSAVIGASAIQFRPPALLSVDLDIAGFASRPGWSFDDPFYADVGPEGLRLSRAIAEAEPESARGIAEKERIVARAPGTAWANVPYWTQRFRGVPGSVTRGDEGVLHLDWRVRNLNHDRLVTRYLAESPEGADKAGR